MPDPGFTRPDLCSTCAVALALRRMMPPALSVPASGGSPPAAAPADGGRAMTVSAAASDRHCATGPAASTAPSACPRRRPCSPWRASRPMSPTGTPMLSSGPTARAGSPPAGAGHDRRPGYASSMVVLYAARHRVPVPCLARWLLGLGIAATLTANMAQGWSHGPVGAVVAAWPAVSLVGSYELLVWLIRTSGTAGPGPSAEHLCDGTACRAVAGSAPAAAADSEQDSRSEREVPGQARQPADRVAGRAAIPASGQRDDAVLRPAPSMTRR